MCAKVEHYYIGLLQFFSIWSRLSAVFTTPRCIARTELEGLPTVVSLILNYRKPPQAMVSIMRLTRSIAAAPRHIDEQLNEQFQRLDAVAWRLDNSTTGGSDDSAASASHYETNPSYYIVASRIGKIDILVKYV
jgi:hypothetical protein